MVEKIIISFFETFKRITNFDFVPLDELDMQFYFTQSYLEKENELIEWIKKLKNKIEELNKELSEIIQKGYMIFDTELLENNIDLNSEFKM